MKLLMVSNKIKTYPLLYKNIIETLEELGHTIIWAADFSQFASDISVIPCSIEQISICTNPLKLDNIHAYNQLLSIIAKHQIEGILCSTPIGGTLARLAAHKKGIAPVLYEAHGFLFFKGVPFLKRVIFQYHEQHLARYTDALITITNEDYLAAQSFKLRSGRIPYLVHGAGINVGNNVQVERSIKLKSLGIPDDALIMISAGEINKNKNTQVIVKALKKTERQDVHYLVCGVGPELEKLKQLVKKLGLNKQVHILGYRTDVAELMCVSDVFVMPSFREGVPRSILEAMDIGLPCVGSDTRGIRDLIDDGIGGYLCKATDEDAFAQSLLKLFNDSSLRSEMGNYNRNKVKPYSSNVVRDELKSIYSEVFV